MTSRWFYECKECGTVRTERVKSRNVRCPVCESDTRPLGEIEFDG